MGNKNIKKSCRLNEENINKQGLHMKIIKYNNANNIQVIFDDGYIANTCYKKFKEGKTVNKNNNLSPYFLSRIGETNTNKQGYLMTIIKYNNCDNIKIKFDDDFQTEIDTRYALFKNGQCRNPNHKTVCGVGYFGKNYAKRETINHKAYSYWYKMINRCYNEKEIKKHPTYKDCIVDKEWHCFENFEKWFDKNYYEINGERMELDKDILIKGNKIYSSNTCIFVPKRINTLFVKRCNNRKGIIGVFYDKERNKYTSYYGCKHKFLGRFNNEIDAFNSYKSYTEKYIKQIADEYKLKYPNFPQKLYNAMYNYQVEIKN